MLETFPGLGKLGPTKCLPLESKVLLCQRALIVPKADQPFTQIPKPGRCLFISLGFRV